MRNIIDAIISFCSSTDQSIVAAEADKNKSVNQINAMGEPFEDFGKKLFAGALNADSNNVEHLLNIEFSHQGQKNNPPDAMIRGGDAIEFKKLANYSAATLELNSSYPEHILRVANPFITDKCRTAEEWSEKDIIYAIGVVKEKSLKRFWMVYGMDYCDDSHEYERLKELVTDAARSVLVNQGYEMSNSSNEPARVISGVDHLNITKFRLRAIWEMATPWIVFKTPYEAAKVKHEKRFGKRKCELVCVINEAKWHALGNGGLIETLCSEHKDGLGVYDIKIKDPCSDNEGNMRDAKMVLYTWS